MDAEIGYLFDEMHEGGVAVRSVNDGYVFAFRLDRLEALVAAAKAAQQDSAVIFVQTKKPSLAQA